MIFAAGFLLSLLPFSLLFGLTAGLLQQSQTFTFLASRPISVQHQSKCLFAITDADDDDVVDEKLSKLSKDQSQPAYDWDEQFEELQLFMSEYGHCNFPQQNPPKELQKKYPTLQRFCYDQRVEYRQHELSKRRKASNPNPNSMILRVFDRCVRLHRLEELGFEFNKKYTLWYDRYHELMQYFSEKGHIRVTEREDVVLTSWMCTQRRKRRGYVSNVPLSESQIKLLDDIGFKWEPSDEHFNERYEELVAFRNEHGHFIMDSSLPLYNWMHKQRVRRDGKKGHSPLTDEQIRLLDDIEFPWKPEWHDSQWLAMYDELKRFQKKHGHCQPRPRSIYEYLYKWLAYQQRKHRKGRLSPKKIRLLDKIGFPLDSPPPEWPKMYRELTEYFNTNGHLQVNQDANPDLYEWMTTQRKSYHGKGKRRLSEKQVEKLEEIHFCWSLDLKERTWHEKYTEAVEFSKEHGHVLVTKKENPSLYNWIQTQGKRYEKLKGQKPLSEEELELLEQLDFPFLEDQPRMAWNAMYAKVEGYREENDGGYPKSHKEDPDLSRWMRIQRHRYRQAYGYAPLSEEQKSLLESINFPMYPEGKNLKTWYERYDELVEFQNQHGHLLVEKRKDTSLYQWADKQRTRFHGNGVMDASLSKFHAYLLERIGFTWTSNQNETKWQRNYEKVVKVLEVRGDFPRRSDNLKLYRWLKTQRRRYNGSGYTKLSEDQIQRLEKIGFQW